MNYGSVPTITTIPAAGAAMGSMWLFLGGLTVVLLALALMRLVPKNEV